VLKSCLPPGRLLAEEASHKAAEARREETEKKEREKERKVSADYPDCRGFLAAGSAGRAMPGLY